MRLFQTRMAAGLLVEFEADDAGRWSRELLGGCKSGGACYCWVMQVHAHHRFSVEDDHRMAEAGVLKPDARVELLDGRIIDMSPIGPLHGGMVNRLIRWFGTYARGRWLVSAQNPVRLDDHSEPEPDLMLLKPVPDDYTSRHPRPNVRVPRVALVWGRGTPDRT